MKIVTLGPEGTFSHEAALTLGGSIIFAHSLEDVFDVLKQDLVDLAVVPLENSLSGSVLNTLDALIECDYKIQAEIILPIAHHLVGFIELEGVKKLFTHPHSYEQCRQSLQRLFMKEGNFENLEIVLTASNAMSAHHLLENKEEGAALLSTNAAALYGIPILKENMQDESNNQTRFVVLSRDTPSRTGKDRTSLIFSPKENRKGLLNEILSVLSKYQLNLTKIESRPSKKKLGEYLFYMDIEGHIQDKAVQEAFKEVQSLSPYQFLGSYPRQF